MQNSVNCAVKCPECDKELEFELTGEANLIVGPETLTIRYLPIVIEHSCPVIQEKLKNGNQ